MARVRGGYVETVFRGKTPHGALSCWRDNWLVILRGSDKNGSVNIGKIILPPQLLGKRIRLKLEILDH